MLVKILGSKIKIHFSGELYSAILQLLEFRFFLEQNRPISICAFENRNETRLKGNEISNFKFSLPQNIPPDLLMVKGKKIVMKEQWSKNSLKLNDNGTENWTITMAL